MPNANKVTIIGHLGKDVSLRYTGSGDAVCNFTVAATEKWKDKAGEWQEKTEWVNVSMFGPTAELVASEFGKGDAVHVEGKLQTRSYEKDGEKKYVTELLAQYVARPIYAKQEKKQEGRTEQRNKHDPFDEDVPF